jgi:hypothetical protein
MDTFCCSVQMVNVSPLLIFKLQDLSNGILWAQFKLILLHTLLFQRFETFISDATLALGS